jgi:hypothetical protein
MSVLCIWPLTHVYVSSCRIISRQDDDGTESWSRRATISLGGATCCSAFRDTVRISHSRTAGVTLPVLSKLMDELSKLRLVLSPKELHRTATA